MHSLRRKGLIGKKKVGSCIGNLYFPFALLSFLQVEIGTPATFRMWMDIRFASVVDMLPIQWCGAQKMTVLQGVRDPFHLPHKYT